MTWIMYAVLPTLIDVIIVKHKRNKTIKKIKENLDEKGYIVDEKAKKRIPKFVIKNYFKEDYVKSDWTLDFSFSYLPIARIFLIFSNISYLRGNCEGVNIICTIYFCSIIHTFIFIFKCSNIIRFTSKFF